MRFKNKHLLIIVSLFVALGAFIFGYCLCSISMMSEAISEFNHLSAQDKHFQLSIITSLVPIGAFIGTFLTNPMVNYLGQRKSMVYLDIFAIVVITFQSYFMGLTCLYLTRFGLGLYLGVSGTIIPSYLVSISPPEMTGIIGSFNQLLITIGVAVGYRLGMVKNITWESYIFFPAYFCMLRILCLVYFKFDSLQKHFKKNQTCHIESYLALFYEDGTIEQLSKLRGFSSSRQSSSVQINSEQTGQNSSQNYRKSQNKSCLDGLTGGAPTNILILGFIFSMANQLSGINAILYYAKQIFEHIVTSQQALNNTYYLGLLQVIVTFISGFMIDNMGRRTLTLFGMGIIMFSLISAFLLDALVANSQNMVIILIFVHIVGFSVSLGPVTFIYAAEVMENLAFIVIVNWIFTILVSLFSEILIDRIGIGKVFLIFGLCTTFCFIYMYRNMIESKGLSRQQLVAKYQQQKTTSPLSRREEEEENLSQKKGQSEH